MAKMRIYTVHINPTKKHPYESPVFLEEGFCWHAFLFQWAWALYHRMWSPAIGVVGFNVLLAYLGIRFGLHAISLAIMHMGFLFFYALHGYDLRREYLRKRGYITVDIVTGDGLISAEQRFFERYFSQNRQNKPSTSATLA